MGAEPADFNTETAIAEFYRDFPEHAGNVFFIDTTRNATYRSLVDRFRDAAKATAAEVHGRVNWLYARTLYHDHNPVTYAVGKNGADWWYSNKTTPLMDFIGMSVASRHGGTFSRFLLTDYFTQQNKRSPGLDGLMPKTRFPDAAIYRENAYWKANTFDHECGHALASYMKIWATGKHSRDFNTNRDESFADAFALIRHYQRFGADTGFTEPAIMDRARLLPFLNRDYAYKHLTLAALKAVAAMDHNKLARLTPRQAAAVAADVVEHHSLTPAQLTALGKIAAGGEKVLKREGFADLIGYYEQAAVNDREGWLQPLVQSWFESAKEFYELDTATAKRLAQAERKVAWSEITAQNRIDAAPSAPTWSLPQLHAA
jgi:hypothetical protein